MLLHAEHAAARRLPEPALCLVPQPPQRRSRQGGAVGGRQRRRPVLRAGDELAREPGGRGRDLGVPDPAAADHRARHHRGAGGELRDDLHDRAQVSHPLRRDPLRRQRRALQDRPGGHRRHQGRQAPRPRGALRPPLPPAGPPDGAGRLGAHGDRPGAALPAAGRGLRRHAADHPRHADRAERLARHHPAAARGLCLRRPEAAAGGAAGLPGDHLDALQPAGAGVAAQGHHGHPRPRRRAGRDRHRAAAARATGSR